MVQNLFFKLLPLLLKFGKCVSSFVKDILISLEAMSVSFGDFCLLMPEVWGCAPVFEMGTLRCTQFAPECCFFVTRDIRFHADSTDWMWIVSEVSVEHSQQLLWALDVILHSQNLLIDKYAFLVRRFLLVWSLVWASLLLVSAAFTWESKTKSRGNLYSDPWIELLKNYKQSHSLSLETFVPFS